MVALSEAFFSNLVQGPRSLPHFRTARQFESHFGPGLNQTRMAFPTHEITAIYPVNAIQKNINALPGQPAEDLTESQIGFRNTLLSSIPEVRKLLLMWDMRGSWRPGYYNIQSQNLL